MVRIVLLQINVILVAYQNIHKTFSNVWLGPKDPLFKWVMEPKPFISTLIPSSNLW